MSNESAASALQGEDLDFLNLLMMVAKTAAVELGEVKAGGVAGKQNLPRARQFINMLVALQSKTEGRRSEQEEVALKSLLEDLQTKYVKAAGLDKADPATPNLGRLAMDAYKRTQKEP